MATKSRKLATGGPYILIQRDNLKTQRRDYLVSLDYTKWKGKGSVSVLGNTDKLGKHFGIDNFAGIWLWKFKTKTKAKDLILLAIMKGIV